jgi:hypothetical protein
MGAALGENFAVAGKLYSHHFVDAQRSVVPFDFVGSDVVSVDGGCRFLLSVYRKCE